MLNPAPSKNSLIYKITGVGYCESRTFLGVRKIPKYMNKEKVRDE